MPNTIGSGTAGRLAYYAVNGTDLSPTSSRLSIDNTAGILRVTDGQLSVTRSTAGDGIYYAQHHATANTNGITFLRTRGTPTAQTAVAANDVLGKFLFSGHDGTAQQVASYIVVGVDGAVATNNLSSYMTFGVRNGATLVPAMSLNKLGQVRTNGIVNLTGTDLAITSTGTLTLNPTGKIVLGTPAKLTITGGTNGQVLTTNGSGTLSWTTVASSYTLPAATVSTLGGVRIGANIAVASDGTISTNAPYSLPTASATVLGGVKVGDGLAIDGAGVLSATGSSSSTPTFTTVTTTTLNVKDVNFTGTGAVTINSSNDLNLNATGVINVNGNMYAGDIYSNGVKLNTSSGATNLDSLTDVQITSPTAGQVLKYNGTTWVNDTDATGSGGAGGLPSRTTKSGTATSLAANSSANIDITAFKGFALYKIQVSSPAWVTVYSSSTARTADASRLQSTDPLPSASVLAEVVTASINETLTFSPALHCYNDDPTVGTTIYLKVKNLSGGTANITVTLTVLQTEA